MELQVQEHASGRKNEAPRLARAGSDKRIAEGTHTQERGQSSGTIMLPIMGDLRHAEDGFGNSIHCTAISTTGHDERRSKRVRSSLHEGVAAWERLPILASGVC